MPAAYRRRAYAALLMAATLPVAASAQLAGRLSLVSDFRLRGLSLNGGGAALNGAVSYDHPSGIYAGASATGGDTRRFGVQFLNHTEYVGYAARLTPRLAWDVGVSNTQVHSNVFRRFSGNYAEVYAGLHSERASLRAWYSPSFIANGRQSVYLDANYAVRAGERLRIFGHGGLLIPIGERGGALPEARTDLRIGAAATFRRAEVQVAWTRSGASDRFLADRRQSRDAIVVGGSFFF